MLTQIVVLAVLLVLGGCEVVEPGLPTMAGSWEGNISSSSINLTATEREQQVIGTGNFASSSSALAFSVDGTHVYPNVSLSIRISGYVDANFTGEFVNENTIAGRMRGSGFTGQDIDLRRK